MARTPLGKTLPDFPWDSLAGAKKKAQAHPGGIVDLSVGNPVDPVAPGVQLALTAAGQAPGSPQTAGTPELREAIAANPPPMKNNRLPKLLFATMASTRPPTIVLFTTGFLDAGYRRYLERKFREQFGYHGTPVRIAVRVRERRGKRG